MMRWLPLVSIAISIATTLALIARDYPVVGHDFRYFIPRLIDTDLHLRLNGLGVQWYTPSFGGGIPAFPNPQHLQYSLVQALTFISDPWMGALVSTAVAIGAGFLGCYRIARSHLGLSATAATLAALFFVNTGFVIEHAIVGHVGFQLFPLASVMVWTLLDRRLPEISRGALLGLLIAMTIYSGGGLIVILQAMTLAVTLPLLAVLRSTVIDISSAVRTAAVAGLFGAAISAPKILSGLMLMRQFPRDAAADPVMPLAQAIAGVASQLVGVQGLSPLLAAMNLDPARAYGVMVRLTGAPRLGIWELDTGVSPVLWLCLVIGGFAAWRSRRDASASHSPARRGAVVLLALATWIVAEAAVGHGVIFPLLKTLPVLNTLHVNPRFGAALTLPLAMVAAWAVDRWLTPRPAIGIALIVASLLSPLSYFLLPATLLNRTFDVSQSRRDAGTLRHSAGAVAALAAVTDAEALSINASSLRPYDPLFGYANEAFTPETHAGEIHALDGGYWNMTHPAGLVFPDENGVRKFERIREADRARLEQFVQRRQPDWALPRVVVWATRVAVPALMLCVFAIAIGVRSRRAAA